MTGDERKYFQNLGMLIERWRQSPPIVVFAAAEPLSGVAHPWDPIQPLEGWVYRDEPHQLWPEDLEPLEDWWTV